MNNKIPIDSPSTYMDYLPAVYRQSEVDGKANFTGRFLKIFEKILSGINDAVVLEMLTPEGNLEEEKVVGIEQILDIIHDYFDPLFTPPIDKKKEDVSDFISYLAKWVALSLDEKWDDNAKRRLLKNIVPLYKRRGTRAGLSEYLRIFVGPHVSINEFLQSILIGETGTVGIDTFVGGLVPHYFIVTISFSEIINIGFVSETVKSTKLILNLEKPAHTYYSLRYKFPGIIVGERSTVSKDTIIGSNFPISV